LRPIVALVSVVVLCPLLVSTALATTFYNNGAVNSVNGPSEDVEVGNGPGDSVTTLDVNTGANVGVNEDDRSIGLAQNSVLNFSGGAAQGDVEVIGDSMAFLFGTASIGGNLIVADNGQLQFSDDSLVEGDVELDDSAHADFSGGTVEGEVIVAGDATANFVGGTFEDTIVGEDNAVITFTDGAAEDNVEAADDSVIYLLGGVVEGSIEAVDHAVVRVTSGQFPTIFSDGEEVLATSGGTIQILGGEFGVAGEESDEGGISVSVNSVVNYSGATIAGLAEGNAPTARMSAALNGQLNLIAGEFGDLALEATSGGKIAVQEVTADNISVNMLGGGVIDIDAGYADSLEILAQVGSVINFRGGDFVDIHMTLQSESVLTIFGHSFTFLGTPVELLSADAYVPATGELRTIGPSLAGVLADGTPFSMSYSRQFNPLPGARVFLVQVPEPGTAFLSFIGLMGLLVRWRWHV
jgi:hypothetical protein